VKKMTVLEWAGTDLMKVVERPRPTITEPGDAIVRITTATVCGSDLHLYHNQLTPGALEKGDILGHEGVGVIEEVGSCVKNFKPGDRVIISAIISCGNCFYCDKGEMSLCLNTNPVDKLDEIYGHRLGGVFGYSHLLGGYDGLQAEFARVPIADVNLLRIPDNMEDSKAILLSDIACTGWHGNELGEVKQGDIVAVWGCGPVGLMIMMWAKFRGASKIIAIDNLPYRLQVAKEKFQAITIDFSQQDVIKTVKEIVPLGPDVCIDAVGYRFSKSLLHKAQRAIKAETDTPEIVTEAIKCVRNGGHVALIGDYFFTANQFPIGAMMEKGITVRGGQVFVQKYWKQLLQYFQEGKVDPTFVITHEMPLEKADEAYRMFDKREDGAIKILLKSQRDRK